MDSWIALGILVLIGVPVGIIILLISQAGLRRRVVRLEGEVAAMQRALDQAEAVAPKVSAPAKITDTDLAAAGEMIAPPQVTPPPVAPPVAAPIATMEVTPAPVTSGPWFGNSAKTSMVGDTAQPPSSTGQNRPLVISADRFASLATWMRDNWVLVIAAVSLALAGVFFVQYGVERGLLPPPLRVLAAIALGIALIAGGEWVRRRQGDGAGATAYLPSTFSGAGIVSMFAGVLAARQMYGLIGPEMAMVGLVTVALIALVLGWFYGPFLAAVGLIGATFAPFVVGGSAQDVTWLYAYFTLIGVLGLGIDTLRRWAWVSVLALVLAVGPSGLLYLDTGQAGVLGVMLTGMVLLSVIIPGRALIPQHRGPTISGAVMARGRSAWPAFPVRLAGGTMLVAAGLMTVLETRSAGEGMVLLICLAGLSAAISLWASKAPALADLAAVSAIAFVVRLVMDVINGDPLSADFAAAAIAMRAPETGGPLTITLILIMVAAMSLTAALRSLSGRDHRVAWAGLAVLLPPAAMGALEAFWYPTAVIGAYSWAVHAMVLAAGMVALALTFARMDAKSNRRRVAYAALAALVLIPFALFALLTKGALTLALAALVAASAVLDRRFRLPELGWFVQAGTIVLGWRLFLDPGLLWAFDAPLTQVALSFLGAVGAMAGGLWLLRGMDRKAPKVFLDSGLVAFAAVFADVLLFRWLDVAFPEGPSGHWAATLIALPWLVVALVQLYRAQLGEFMGKIRMGLAAIAGAVAAFGLGTAVTIFNPLVSSDPVGGPLILDTLLIAYGLPGLILLGTVRFFGHLPTFLRNAFLWVGAGFVALYAGLEIRHFWQGPILSNYGTTQGELYTYTLALMLTGAALLYQAIAARSVLLRRIGMAVIALTIAKVFLIDISGLSGLTRVVAFLGLGLSLAALAWLNRWAAERSGQPG